VAAWRQDAGCGAKIQSYQRAWIQPGVGGPPEEVFRLEALLACPPPPKTNGV